MDNFENLLKTSLEEFEKVLTTKTVVGEPIKVEGTTIIPLISVGFGFGGGNGNGKSKAADEGSGNGLGGGGGVKPLAVVIIDKDGNARVEQVTGGRLAESLAAIIGKAKEKAAEAKKAA